jgi:hypothetical protein
MDVLHPPALLNWEEKLLYILSRSVGVLLVLGTIVHYDRSVELWIDPCGPLTCLNAEPSINGAKQQEESCRPVKVR